MQFINIAMLFGLLAVAIPILIQIFTRRNTRRTKWGAWQFLDATVQKRKRKVLLEDILLLACRCLALGLLALAFARPFVRPDSPVPWAVTMPVLLLSITAIGISFALWRYPKYRLWMMSAGIALFALSIATVVFERQLNLKRFGLGANKDVVLIVDGSASMSIVHDGKTNFERAVEEAKKYVELAPRNTSFAVIIGGPVPQVMNPVPVADKRVIINTLDRIRPSNGTMAISANLTAASVTLAAGHNAVKQIVIVGDGQTVGWNLGDAERWKTVRRVFGTLKTQPIVTWRTLPLPTSIRNLAIAGVRPSRDIVGADREVDLEVTVVNAGTEAVTPGSVSLTVEGKTLSSRELHQLQPGESQTFRFPHRFLTPGGKIVTAKVDSGDDMASDDVYRYAMPILGALKVLLIDGDASSSFMNRASTYVRLALRPELVKAAEEAVGAPKHDYLLDVEVEDVVAAGNRVDFSAYSAVIMLGVRRLSESTRSALGRFVAAGGGLFVMPAVGADEEFFNEWKFAGKKVLPAPLGKWRANSAAVDPSSFGEMLSPLRSGTDLGSAVPEKVMEFGEGWTADALPTIKLADGSAFVLSHSLEKGSVLLSATAFDPASALVSKRAFVPMMHELVYSLARPASVKLDTRPSEGMTVLLATGATSGDAGSVEGLTGFYFPHPGFQGKPVIRTDPRIEFRWGNNSPLPDFPADNFTVVWRGTVMLEEGGKRTISWDVDDHFSLKIGGKNIPNRSEFEFEPGVSYAIEGRYEEDWAGARVFLFWQAEGSRPQIIPSKAFKTRAAGGEGAGEIVEMTDPHGEAFYAEIFQSDTGIYLHTSRSVIPGVYSVRSLPPTLVDICQGVVDDSGKINISVSAGVEESTLTAITQNGLSELGKYVQISQAIKDEDVINAIGGRSFGKETWRVLAFAAFLFLVAEPAIARWIAKNRRTGDIIDTEGSWIRT